MLKELIDGMGSDLWVLSHLSQEQADVLNENIGDIKKILAKARYQYTALGIKREDAPDIFINSLKGILNSMIAKKAQNQP